MKSTGSGLAFIRVLRLGLGNARAVFAFVTVCKFGRLRTSSDFFGRLRNSSGIFGNDRVVFKNPSTPRIKISRLYLRKSWQVYIHVHLEASYNPSFISSQLKEVGESALKSNTSLSLLCISEISPQPPAHLTFSVS